MKKLSTLLIIAFAMVLGLTQCKKKVDTIATPSDLGEAVHITVNVDDGGKHIVYPGTGAYVFENGDKLYVGNNGHYIGTLTYSDGAFRGDITKPTEGEDLYFYFLGGINIYPETATISYEISIANQSSKLPVLSFGRSTSTYTTSTTTYRCTLLNKCGMVKFVPSTGTSNAIAVGGMRNVAKVDFATPGITPTGATGNVTLYSESNTAKWAILLEQDAVPNPTVTVSGYTVTVTNVPAITNNMYYSTGVNMLMTTAASVTTKSVTSITTTSASSGGTSINAGGGNITAKGVCWGTSANPTISGSHTSDGTGTADYNSLITGLTEGTTYHVRAYVTNELGTSYGSDVSFTTKSHLPYIDANFTVASGRTVKFASGNLQYQGSTDKFRFAAHQYDHVGDAAGNTAPSASQTAWIDLFGWGTSGYDKKYPYMTSTTNSDYGYYENNIAGTNYDWGVYNKQSNQNKIENGGNHAWRTLTMDEWAYLFNTRSNTTVNGTSNARFTKAYISTPSKGAVKGVIIFPDSYSGGTPAGVTWGTINTFNGDTTTCTADGWEALEAAGCVFLPATGYRYGSSVYHDGFIGYYWSSSIYIYTGDILRAYCVYFNHNYEDLNPTYNDACYYGFSVRLVF